MPLSDLFVRPTMRPALTTDPPDPAYEAAIKATPWYQEFPQRYHGEQPNLYDPQYNMRRALQLGLQPQRDPNDKYSPNSLHWPDAAPGGEMLKSPEHPTVWMQYFMNASGGKDPEALGLGDYLSARKYIGRDFVPPDVFSALKARGEAGP